MRRIGLALALRVRIAVQPSGMLATGTENEDERCQQQHLVNGECTGSERCLARSQIKHQCEKERRGNYDRKKIEETYVRPEKRG
jgi:hypothetical protein